MSEHIGRRRFCIGLAAAGLGTTSAVAASCPNFGIKQCEEAYGSALCLRLQTPRALPVPAREALKSGIDHRKNSGVVGFDDALKQGVLKHISTAFGVAPNFAFYDDLKYDGRLNAVATSNGAGEVRLGLGITRAMLRVQGGDYALMAICAHEYGHIRQFKSDLIEELRQDLPCFAVELHADFLAGYFIGKFREIYGAADLTRIGQVWQAWDKESCTHGSMTQRVEAISAGYEFARSTPKSDGNAAAAAGKSFISKYRR